MVDVSSYIRHCNYFNTLENGVDQAHVPFTHSKSNFTRFGLNWDIPKITAEETEYGVAMYGTRSNGVSRVNHYLMPNILYIKGSPDESAEMWRDAFAWRVPIDDLSHASFNVSLVHITGEAAERYRERRRQRRATAANLPSAREIADAVLAGKLHPRDRGPARHRKHPRPCRPGRAGAIPDRNAERSGPVGCRDHPHEKIWARVVLAFRRPATENMELAGHSLCQQRSITMRHARVINTGAIVILLSFLVLPFPLRAAETLDQLIAAAKKEGDLYFVAGPGTFGGKKGLAEIEAAFNKKFGLNSRVLFTAGPEMNSMAARVISEYKVGGKASTDIYLGSLGQFAHLQKERVLEEANLSVTFPWVSKNMEEILRRKSCSGFTHRRGESSIIRV